MAAEIPQSELEQRRTEVGRIVTVLEDVPVSSYEPFEESVYDGDIDVVGALAGYIRLCGKDVEPRPPYDACKQVTAKIGKYNFLAEAATRGTFQSHENLRVFMDMRQRYLPFISWHPKEWAVELHGRESLGIAHYWDRAVTHYGKKMAVSTPADFRLQNLMDEYRFHREGFIDHPYFNQYDHKASIEDIPTPWFQIRTHVMHFRDNLQQLSAMLLVATGTPLKFDREALLEPPQSGLRLVE